MIKCTFDTKAFDKAFDEYLKFSKKAVPDIINAKLYYIARNATTTTQHSDKGKIASELREPSRINPNVPIAAILVNKQLRAKKEKGLSGSAMTQAVNKFIRKRQASVNFIRSGWKNAIKQLEAYLSYSGELGFVKRYGGSSKVDTQTMNKRVAKSSGQAIPAPIRSSSARVYGEIQNNLGGDGKPSLEKIKTEGLQEAINREVASMRLYIERKLNEGSAKFNR